MAGARCGRRAAGSGGWQGGSGERDGVDGVWDRGWSGGRSWGGSRMQMVAGWDGTFGMIGRGGGAAGKPPAGGREGGGGRPGRGGRPAAFDGEDLRGLPPNRRRG